MPEFGSAAWLWLGAKRSLRVVLASNNSPLTNWKRGKVSRPRYIVELSEALNVPLEWLRHGKGQVHLSRITSTKDDAAPAWAFEPELQTTPDNDSENAYFELAGAGLCARSGLRCEGVRRPGLAECGCATTLVSQRFPPRLAQIGNGLCTEGSRGHARGRRFHVGYLAGR